jgi:S-adenosylmethionine-diacylglycerol 3-amino-3-carboxypropyl transferase
VFDEGIVTSFDRANLSDIFEYMSTENATALFQRLADAARPGARLAYWNMMVPRRASELLPDRVRRLDALSRRLFLADKAFFYRDFVVDEVVPPV